MASKYPEIKEAILENIHNNIYLQGQMLPTERELTSTFNVSRMTIRRALDELINEGILIRRTGSGVIVAYNKQTRNPDKHTIKYDKDIIKEYGEIKTKVLEVKHITSHPIADMYFHNKGNYYQLRRVQYGNDQPLIYENIFLDADYFEDIRNIDCSKSMSKIYSKIIKNAKQNKQDIYIDAKVATKEISSILQVPLNAPILQITNVEKQDDIPLLFSIDSFNGETFNYSLLNQEL